MIKILDKTNKKNVELIQELCSTLWENLFLLYCFLFSSQLALGKAGVQCNLRFSELLSPASHLCLSSNESRESGNLRLVWFWIISFFFFFFFSPLSTLLLVCKAPFLWDTYVLGAKFQLRILWTYSHLTEDDEDTRNSGLSKIFNFFAALRPYQSFSLYGWPFSEERRKSDKWEYFFVL